jgi:hypothetical protein
MARPSKLTTATTASVCAALRAGTTRAAAARAGGVDYSTFARWLPRHRDFREAVEQAEAEAQRQHEAIIVQAASGGNWQASAWWLERRRPADYGRKVDVGGQRDNPIQLVVTWPGVNAPEDDDAA